jgi:peptidoglycan/LPS O-acetylase OafA/YrhL
MTPSTPPTPSVSKYLPWLDQIRGIGLILVFLAHGMEQILEPPFFSNPMPNWPPLADRIAQILPLTELGWANLPVNLLRYLGYLGDQGVQLFLIASGFGLTWSLLWRSQVNQSISWPGFYRRRLLQIYPLWWVAHLGVLGLQAVSHKIPEASLLNPGFYLSLVGIRGTAGLMYSLSPSWWFIGLLVQLYLIYPLLWNGLQTLGAKRFLWGLGAIAISVRGVGLFVAGDYIDYWSRGSIFIARLPEFLLGMGLALWFFQDSGRIDRQLRSRPIQILGWVSYGLGLVCGFTLWGMTISPFLLGLGLFILLYGLLQGAAGLKRLPLLWLGRHSYAIFLVEHLVTKALVPYHSPLPRGAIGLALSAGLSIAMAIGLEKVTGWLGQQVINHEKIES